MDILRYTDDFFAMEKEHDLFSKCINGTPWWDIARHDVFYFIYYRLSGAKIVQPPKRSLFVRIIDKLIYQWLYIKLRVNLAFRHYDVLVLRCPRHTENGRRVDIILDDILACTSGRQLVINTFPYYYHIRSSRGTLEKFAPTALCNLNAVVRERFGLDVDVESFVSSRFTQYREVLSQY
jgi:hypothetical protein